MAAEDSQEYKKLPPEERCVCKAWKGRLDGLEETIKIFREIDDEKSNDWQKYVPIIKKIVADSHALAQEKGLEAALIFVENSFYAGRTVNEVMSAIVQKCIAAPKAKTKELSVQIALMYIEIEKHEVVIEELIKGMEHKNPKIVAACASTCTLALREFGTKVVSVKALIKKLAPLMSDRDKTVREEGKQMAIEIYRWIGAAMKPQIASLPPITIKELEDEFDKLKGEKAEPTRYLRSQQEKQQQLSVRASANCEEAGDDEEAEAAEEIDPMDLIDPVDILSKLPKDFYEKLKEKKWTLRKESLEALEKLLNENPKLENGEYGTLIHALKKVITEDSNVVLVALGTKCLAMLAKGLGKRFTQYAMICIPFLLEKFKEKKANVLTALRDAMDAIYPSTNLEAMQECVVESLGNKNPSVKAETASFLARSFTITQPQAINKKLLKLLTTTLTKTLNESDPTVRECSAEALGTLMKLVGEKSIGPLLVDIDALKTAKIKEFYDKAEIKIKIGGTKRSAAAQVTKAAVSSTAPTKTGVVESKPNVSRPASSASRKAVTKKPGGGSDAAKNISSQKVQASKTIMATEREMSLEEIAEKAEELLSADILNGLSDSNWKNRLVAVENLMGIINSFDSKTAGISQILIKTISGRKPGLKEMNFQVLKIKLDIIRVIAETYLVTTVSIDAIVNEVTDKLADPKNGTAASEALSALAEATKLDYVAGKVFSFAFEQKSPKVQAESLNWLNKAIQEFGFQVQPKVLIEDVRKAVQSTNPTVRGAAISLIGTLSMYMGSALMMFFDNEKPALKAQIQTEFEKNVSEKPPKPTRGIKKLSRASGGEDQGVADEGNNGTEDDNQEQINIADLLPRVDISSQISEALLQEMADKDWKNRNEGLNKLQLIISQAKLIKPNLGDLPPALALRLSDSNAKIAQSALSISEQLANAMGPGCKSHVRTLFPGFLHALGDSKSFVRAAALNCINTFGEKGGYKEFFEGEMIADCLKTGSPALRAELWLWLAERLQQMPPKSIPKDELNAMIPSLYAQICDRNADVRKNANEAVLGVMIHLGYEAMLKALDKQKPASKKDIQAALDKARPNLPIKPLPKGKQQAPIPEEPKKTVRGGGGGAGGSSASSRTTLANKNTAATEKVPSRKKEDDVDTSPLLAINNSKSQRMIDEQKSKVLKWNFTTPREEYTELLRDQMTVANVNKALMANMFHDDFRYHLKVIESLTEDLTTNSKALVCNLDLVLKWLSLRFYDTNPSVLIKGLEYLNQVFQILIEMDYILAEHEGNSFIPHLLLKLGDPKDAVRNGVRTLLRQILLVYPYTKMFSFVIEGLKSKNARQRTECLDELSFLIESYGLTVCQPSQQVALKEIAKQISDRDNSVRNAALNCIANAYFIAGDKIYKLIGQMSEKDLSMLDERIKRVKKTRKAAPTESVQPGTVGMRIANSTTAVQIVQQDSIEIDDPTTECDELPPPDEEGFESSDEAPNAMEASDPNHTVGSLNRQATFDQIQPSSTVLATQQPKTSGPFGLDPEKIAEIEKDWVRVEQLPNVEIQKVDISLLYEPIVVKPSHDGVNKYPEEKFQQILSSARYRAQTTPTAQAKQAGYLASGNVSPYMSPQQNQQYNNSPANTTANTTNLADMLPKLDPVLMKTLKHIGCADTIKARAAINEITDIVASPEKVLVLKDYEEIFITNVLAQLKNLSQLPTQEALPVYQPLLSILYSFFQAKNLGKQLSIPCLKNLVAGLLNLMVDQKLTNCEEMQYNKVINGICLKVLDRADFTNLNCALIRLLRETCPSAGLPKFLDLLMKCIWRNVKMLGERSKELNYDLVILEVHEFMLALPSSWWQARPSDTPLRTVKTIIHNMAKVKGNAILEHLNVIPAHSELHTYLIKILKNLQREGSLPSASPQRSNASKDVYHQSKRLSNQTHETMSQIFKLISEKETKQQGLQKLYEFKTQNPGIDIETFLKGASSTFQKYIEDGLTEIERLQSGSKSNPQQSNDYKIGSASSAAGQETSTFVVSAFKTNTQQQQIDPEYWMDRLNNLKARANLGPNRNAMDGNILTSTGHHILDNKVVDENLCLNSMNGQKISLIRTEKPDIDPNRLQHIQAKLAKLKKGTANTQI